jgi:hypothetical protein
VCSSDLNEYFRTYTEASGAWDIITDNGPVLTFNTYNDIFTLYSDPALPGQSEGDGKGLEGDYEFIIMKKTSDEVTLRGKKHGTTIMLRKMEDNKAWIDYFNQLATMDKFLFGATYPQQYLSMGDSTYTVSNGTKHIFSMLAPGGDPVFDTEYVSFLVTDYGIRLAQSLKKNKLSVQRFILNDTKSALIDAEGSSVTITAEKIGIYAEKTNSKYFAVKDELSGKFLEIFNKMADQFAAQYNGNRNLVSFGFTKKTTGFCFLLKAGSNEAAFTVPYSVDNDKITISTFDGNNMVTTDMDNNARLFYAAIPSIKEVLALIQGTYDLSSDERFSLNSIKYTKTGSPADYLIVRR